MLLERGIDISSANMINLHRAGQRCFELLALIGSPQLSEWKITNKTDKAADES